MRTVEIPIFQTSKENEITVQLRGGKKLRGNELRPGSSGGLKIRYCPLSIERCDLLAAIFVMLKILRLLFATRIELFNNNGRLAPLKTKTTTEAREA